MSSTVRHSLPHVPVTSRLPALAIAGVLALAGCGSGRATPPDLTTTAAPSAFETIAYPADGLELQVPTDWTVTDEKAPLIAAVSSGEAVISLWRYPSTARRPGARQMRGVLAAIVGAARATDPSLQVTRSAVTSVDGAEAVILDAQERIAGRLRRVRSEHVYVPGAEIVLEAYAPPAQFAGVDHAVFSPVRQSLTLLNQGTARSDATPITSTVTTPTVTISPTPTLATPTVATSTTSTLATRP